MPRISPRKRSPPSLLNNVAWTAGIATVLFAFSAWLLCSRGLYPRGPSAEEINAFREAFVPERLQIVNIQLEPAELFVFAVLAILSPVFIGAAAFAQRAFAEPLAQRWHRAAIFADGAYAAAIACLASLFLFRAGIFGEFVLRAGSPLVIACALFFTTAATVLAIRSSARRGPVTNQIVFWGCVLLTVVLALLPRGFSIHSITDRPVWSYHFQAVSYAMTQVFAGRTVLSDVYSLYGLYPEILLPWFKLMGLSVFRFCVTMAVLQAAGQVALLCAARLLIRNNVIFALGGVSLAYAAGGIWPIGISPEEFDPYFAYAPLRFLFPAVATLLFVRLMQQPTKARGAAVGLVTAFAILWNLESGIAVAGAVTGAAGLDLLSRRRAGSASVRWSCYLTVGAAAGATLASAAIYLPWKADAPLDWSMLYYYQRLFTRYGYSMLPLPVAPHTWMLLVFSYIAGLSLAFACLVRRRMSVHAVQTGYVALLGVGLFVYYLGRSHDFNLPSIWWPALLLAMLFADRAIRGVSAGILPFRSISVALPGVLAGLLCTLVVARNTSAYVKAAGDSWGRTVHAAPSGPARNVEFIRQSLSGARSCVILAGLQAVYYGELGLRSELPGSGLTELFMRADWERAIEQLTNAPTQHLFLDTKMRTDPTLARLKEIYEVTGQSPDRDLLHLVPKRESRTIQHITPVPAPAEAAPSS